MAEHVGRVLGAAETVEPATVGMVAALPPLEGE
jgi:hypothetical protein